MKSLVAAIAVLLLTVAANTAAPARALDARDHCALSEFGYGDNLSWTEQPQLVDRIDRIVDGGQTVGWLYRTGKGPIAQGFANMPPRLRARLELETAHFDNATKIYYAKPIWTRYAPLTPLALRLHVEPCRSSDIRRFPAGTPRDLQNAAAQQNRHLATSPN